MAKTPKLGDVFEIKAPCGFAYFQYTYKDSIMGQLIRILPGIFNNHFTSFKELVKEKELYYIYFPLAAAVKKSIVKNVSNESIPEWAQSKPVMRRAGGMTPEGKVLNWWICDNQKEKLVNSLTNEEKHYSIEEIWNDTMLTERICSGWLPEKTT